MSQIGGGALASGLLSAGAAKIVASVLGPAGVAVLGTLQQCRETGAVAATLNGQTALVQGASHLTGVERREFLRTSLCLFGTATLAVILGLVAAPEQVARMAGLGMLRAPLIRWLTLPVALASLYIFLNGLVSALGAIRALAGLQLAAPGALLLLAYPAAMGAARHQENWFSMLLTVSAALAAAAAALALARHRRELESWIHGSGRWWSGAAARRFFLLSGSMLSSGLASNGVLVLVRAQMLRREGLTVTGQFDAAWSIGLNLSTLLLASLPAYHLPALAKARTAPERVAHLWSVLRVVAPAAVVLIVGLAALKPVALAALYSPEFGPAALYLRWTLPGVYLKVTAWVLAAPMLACTHAKVFLAAELAAWLVFSAGTAALARWRGTAESAAMAFVLMYVVHLAISFAYVRRYHGFRWDPCVGPLWLAGLGLITAVSVAHWSPLPGPLLGQLSGGALWILAAVLIQILLLRRGRTECAE